MNKRKQTALNAIKQILHNAGLRITPQRVVIYSAVLKCANHPCAEKIYKAISLENPNISFDTVNRTLISF
nr:transcriptional repressor [bacterium]